MVDLQNVLPNYKAPVNLDWKVIVLLFLQLMAIYR